MPEVAFGEPETKMPEASIAQATAQTRSSLAGNFASTIMNTGEFVKGVSKCGVSRLCFSAAGGKA